MSIESPRLSRAVAQLPNQPQVADAPTAALSSTDLKIGQLIPVTLIGIIASYIHPNGRDKAIDEICKCLRANPVEKAQVVDKTNNADSLETQQKEVERIIDEYSLDPKKYPLPVNGRVYTAAICIELKDAVQVSQEVVGFLQRNCPHMHTLSLTSLQIPDSLLREVAKCIHLKKLSLLRKPVTPQDPIFSTLPREDSPSTQGLLALRSLALLESFSTNVSPHNMTVEIAKDFLKAFPHLKELDLSIPSPDFDSTVFFTALGSIPHLERLHIQYLRTEDIVFLTQIPSLLTRLQELRIPGGFLQSDAFQHLEKFTSLKKLSTSHYSLKPVSIEILQALKALSHPYYPHILSTFLHRQDLEELKIPEQMQMMHAGEALTLLTSFPALRKLQLYVSNYIFNKKNPATHWFRAPALLESLHLVVEIFDTSIVKGLKQAACLRSLKLGFVGQGPNLEGALHIDDVLLAITPHLPELRELELYLGHPTNRITCKGFSALLHCKKLEKVTCNLQQVGLDTLRTTLEQHECLSKLMAADQDLDHSSSLEPLQHSLHGIKNGAYDHVIIDPKLLIYKQPKKKQRTSESTHNSVPNDTVKNSAGCCVIL